jgi:hypothetical protein
MQTLQARAGPCRPIFSMKCLRVSVLRSRKPRFHHRVMNETWAEIFVSIFFHFWFICGLFENNIHRIMFFVFIQLFITRLLRHYKQVKWVCCASPHSRQFLIVSQNTMAPKCIFLCHLYVYYTGHSFIRCGIVSEKLINIFFYSNDPSETKFDCILQNSILPCP